MRLLRAISLFLQRVSWRPVADWSAADARALATFLGTPTGAKLQEILRREIAAANERAAMKGLRLPRALRLVPVAQPRRGKPR